MLNWFKKNKKYQDLNPADFEQAVAQTPRAQLVVLDVRTPHEFASGHLPAAKNMDIMAADFATQVEKLDRQKEYFVYCRSGGRSARACQLMAEKGFTRLYNLAGGITSWKGPVAI